MSKPLRRFACDSALGIAMLLAVAGLVAGLGDAQAQSLSADIVTFETSSTGLSQQFLAQLPLSGAPSYASWLPEGIFRNTGPSAGTILLAIVFAVLTALNIGFWRHLQQAYAPQRRDRRRRG